jgi:GH24 family phage-related lysozyme (muramidase)
MTTPYTPKLLPAIEAAEGFSPIPYRDPRGHLTIGFGHKLPNPPNPPAQSHTAPPTYSPENARILLMNDVAAATLVTNRLFPQLALPSVRTDVLIELAFILGGGPEGLPSWTKLIAAVNDDKPTDVAWEILNSKAFRQIPERLLTLALRYLTRRY